MGYELKKLMNMYGVSTPTMAPAPQMPGAAPTAPAQNATADQQAKYAADKAAFDENVRKYGLDKAQYDQYAQDYQNRLANTNMYNQAQFSTTGANVPAFTTYSDAQKAALGYGPAVTPTVMPQPESDVGGFIHYWTIDENGNIIERGGNPNPVANPLRVLAGETKTQYLERVKGMGTPGRGQNAPPGMMYGPDDRPVPINPPQPASGPQDFTGIGQGGLNQQIQNYMGTNPSMPDLNAYMTRYGITDYDIRNAMGTGTTYGAPQWTDTLASPVYGAPITTMPVDTGGTTMPVDTGGTTMPVDTGGTTGTTTTGGTTQGGGGRDRDGMGGMGDRGNGTGTGSFGLPDPFGGGSRNTSGGYTGLRYMFDGGGPGRSGTRGGYTGLRDMFDGGGPGRSRAKAEGGYIKNYAQGGSVKGYRPGGPVDMLYGGAGNAMMMGGAEEDTLTTPAPVAENPQDAMMAMLERYAPKPVDYSPQIAAATERRAAEQKAFEELLMGQLNAQDSAPQSKAEMYFRLAAAFGAPTKTGNFSENLGLVGQTMAEELSARSERERAARDAKLGVQTELQKMRMEAAGGELETLRGLQESETAYGREMARDMLEKYVTSGKPQSEAGKIATDMGLKPGTPEHNAMVKELTQLKIEREMAAINATIASTEAQQTQANQMNATEIKLRSETEDALAGVNQSLEDLKEAYRLNPNTFAGGLYDKFVLGASELVGSDDPKVVNTRLLTNLLESQALEKLKATFGGSGITNAEREALSALQGAGAKSTEERGQIILRAYEVLQDIQARQTKKLDEILSGAYRQYKPIDGGE